jgi:geranylgeranyl diphosphate synthase type II
MELGGMIAGADETTTQLLYDAGLNMGLGFQLKDDLLDVYGDPEKFGKQVGGDIIANKKTFMLIEALLLAEGETKEKLDYWLHLEQGSYDTAAKVAAVTAIYTELGIDKIAESKSDEFFTKGFEALHNLLVAPERKKPLIEFAEFLVGRES